MQAHGSLPSLPSTKTMQSSNQRRLVCSIIRTGSSTLQALGGAKPSEVAAFSSVLIGVLTSTRVSQPGVASIPGAGAVGCVISVKLVYEAPGPVECVVPSASVSGNCANIAPHVHNTSFPEADRRAAPVPSSRNTQWCLRTNTRIGLPSKPNSSRRRPSM